MNSVIAKTGTNKLPKKGDVIDGKTVEFCEHFVSGLSAVSEERAYYILGEIRAAHPKSYGWVELGYEIFTDGKMFGVERHHYKTNVRG